MGIAEKQLIAGVVGLAAMVAAVVASFMGHWPALVIALALIWAEEFGKF